METYARRRLERNVLSTLLTNKGRDDVVVLLDRAVGARREGRKGRHHDLGRLLEAAGARGRREGRQGGEGRRGLNTTTTCTYAHGPSSDTLHIHLATSFGNDLHISTTFCTYHHQVNQSTRARGAVRVILFYDDRVLSNVVGLHGPVVAAGRTRG